MINSPQCIHPIILSLEPFGTFKWTRFVISVCARNQTWLYDEYVFCGEVM